MPESKNKAVIKCLRKNYVRFSLDFKPDVLAEFREICAKEGTTATTVIKAAVAEYVKAHK